MMETGPWGPKDGSQTPNKKPGKASDQKKTTDADFEDFVKKSEDVVKNFFKSKDNKGGGDNKTPNNFQTPNSGPKKAPKSVIGLIFLGVILLWLLSGFYKVDPDENAVTLYFGKFYQITTPGLNYHVPYPFGQVIKKRVVSVNTEEFGFSSYASSYNRNFDAESLMLTGDENIVDVEFQVQWQIADIKDFVFNVANTKQTIRKAAESAMREVIAKSPIADALSDGKRKIEGEVKKSLQETLDYYGGGVRITLVQLLRVDPPAQVINAFRDVQTAKADKEKEINEAQSFSNDVIPRARGEASKMKEDSEAHAKKVVANAQGEAGRFLSVYRQYAKSKQVTRKRIYLETMEELYKNMDKVIIDSKASNSGVVPYLPLSTKQKVQ